MVRPRYRSWLLQAESDLLCAKDLIKAKHFSQACFTCQQAAEKALKSLAFFRGADLVKSHSLGTIAKDLGINGELATFAIKLDLFYLTARYPDALPENSVPSESFTKEMAVEAYKMSECFLNAVRKELK